MLRLLTLSLLASLGAGVDRSKFRTCETAAFCARHRGKASEPEVRARRPRARDGVRAPRAHARPPPPPCCRCAS